MGTTLARVPKLQSILAFNLGSVEVSDILMVESKQRERERDMQYCKISARYDGWREREREREFNII